MTGNNIQVNDTSTGRLNTCKNKINFDFIHDLEGFKLKGYVPEVSDSNSGVTVASGFDIGARSKEELINLGFDNKLVDKLSPYCGKKKYEAINFLEENPLTITEEEATIIDNKVKEKATAYIEKLYNKDSSIKLFCLPEQAQTVIASVSFQYGNLFVKTPTFWNYIIKQDWKKAINELNNFNDDYSTRRKKEAKYLEGVLE